MMTTQFGKNRATAMLLAILLLLTLAPPAMAETFSAIVTSGKMTVYADARLSNEADTLEKGAVVRVTAYSGKAARITYSGRTGFAKVADMKPVDAVAAKGLTGAIAKVYEYPAESARSMELGKGTRLYVLSWSGEWARVEKDGAVGYIKMTALTHADDDWNAVSPDATPTPVPASAAQRGIVSAETLPVYKEADTKSTKLGTLKQGQLLNVLKWDSKWAYVELNGRYGYCAVKGLTRGVQAEPTPAPSRTVTVTAKTLPVYKRADAKSDKLGTLEAGRQVALVSESGDWALIELEGRQGYCAASGLSSYAAPTSSIAPTATPSVEDAARGQVTVASLTVYKTASAKGTKLTTLQKGDIVNVIKWNDQWAYIEAEGVYGFCAVSGLTKTDVNPTAAPTATPALDTAVKATVTEENVAVYRLAGDSSTELGALMWGEQVNLLSVSDGWAYIEKSGRYGFCRASALTKVTAGADEVPAGYKKANFTATVVYPSARAYESAAASGEGTAIALGTNVTVTGYSEDLEWASITTGTARLFMPIKHLSRTEYETVSGQGSDMQTLLKALLSYGYFDGVPATADSAAATAAIKRFQAACGLEQTGAADETVQRILYAGYAPDCELLAKSLTTGDKGDDVTRVQLRLYALGYLGKSVSLDGSYGATTAAAVSLFQQNNGLSPTGTANSETLKKLYSTAAAAKPSSAKAADAESASSGSVVNPSGTVKLSSTYVTTMPSELKSNTSSFSSGMSNAQKLEHVIYSAQVKLGCTYVYGATGPNTFDCSGLTQYSFKKVNVSLLRTAYSQGYDSSYDKVSSVSSLKRGDLVFFNTISDSDLCDHVGIYLGGGCFIHASSGGHKVVVSNITSGYYNRVFSWGRRILK